MGRDTKSFLSMRKCETEAFYILVILTRDSFAFPCETLLFVLLLGWAGSTEEEMGCFLLLLLDINIIWLDLRLQFDDVSVSLEMWTGKNHVFLRTTQFYMFFACLYFMILSRNTVGEKITFCNSFDEIWWVSVLSLNSDEWWWEY